MPERGPLPSNRMSLAILKRPAASAVQRAVHEDERVMRGERLEFVRRGDEGQAGRSAPLRAAKASAKPVLRVEAGADRRAALRERIELRQVPGVMRAAPSVDLAA